MNALADVWLNNPANRDEITQAAAATDQVLAENPEAQGESRDEGNRVAFVTPLVVFFRVDEVRKVAHVLEIRGTRRRNR